ncbi:hypothetical protein OG304_01180 [Streptomyces sp. NBC_00160]|nr:MULTISPECIES: hypothetical protein [Streptomyces]MCX5302069.1 hypothetical protein [Streptomyces sp. NBC_00160]
MTHPQEYAPRRQIPSWAPWLCWGGLIIGIILMLVYWLAPPLVKPDPGAEVQLQFAAGEDPIREAVLEIIGGNGSDRAELFKDGLLLDWQMFVPGYTLALAAVFGFGTLFLYRSASRTWARRALAITAVPLVADCAENLFLYLGLERLDGDPDWAFTWAAYCAQVKWTVVVPLVAAALWAGTTLAFRLVLRPRAEVQGPQPPHPRAVVRSAHKLADGSESWWDDPDVIAPPAAPHSATPLADWTAPYTPPSPNGAARPGPKDSAKARWHTRALQLPGREPAEVGICASGGGIRSASVVLGALQALRDAGVVRAARYLVSVSGGGFTAGAFQLALTPEQPRDKKGKPFVRADLATPEDVFAPGSPEEDHVRRHAKYLADSPKEKLQAAGTVLRGMFVSLGMLALIFTVAGMYLHAFYSFVPLTDLDSLRHPDGRVPDFRPYAHVRIPVLALIALAGVVTLVASLVRASTGKSRPAWVRSTIKTIVALALAVAAYTVVFPAVIWFFVWLADTQTLLPKGGRGVSLLAVLTAAATWLGALYTAAHKSVKKLKPDGDTAGMFSKSGKSITVQSSTGWVKAIVCWLVLLLLGFFGLALLSWVAVYAGEWDWWWKWGLPVALLVLPFLIDQTTFSLHPFYRQRLAGAFAVRRAVLKDGSVGGLPYDYNAEPTSLSTHARKVDRFPQVIFAASAAVSLRNRTAPGRPAVPFTFASDYVGGPDTGWVRTSTMEATARPLIRRDITVQSAVAVSGAAFASAMGTQTMFFERLLALSNLRLGTWVPNPAYLAELAKYGPDWTMPRLPRMRRLRYQLQELVGRYSDTSPMLLCTDGGHFDNLGLVEMLRLRCRTIYVIDSSGDTPPLATTLAQAVTLAYEDLGVVIEFPKEEVLKLVPGSAAPLKPTEGMAALNARFSASCVVTGTIKYPEPVLFDPDAPPSDEGTIIFAKANLTPDMSYELLSYALKEKAFPRQATFDQWFDHAQFDAYRALGHFLGTAAGKAGKAGKAGAGGKHRT